MASRIWQHLMGQALSNERCKLIFFPVYYHHLPLLNLCTVQFNNF